MSESVVSDRDRARRAKNTLADRLGEDDRIAGIGLAPAPGGGYQLKLNLREPVEGLPTDVDGVPVSTEVVGDVRTS